MMLGELPGQRLASALLERVLSSGRMPHALLLQGPEGVGKAEAAQALASALLCETGVAGACGFCPACVKVRQRCHPDVLWVGRLSRKGTGSAEGEAEEGEPTTEQADRGDLRKDIVVSQIRELSEHALYAPREGRYRIFIIDPADRMNPPAQNALLKTLEEPPGRSILILVASRPHLLLPTVRSRCLAVRFAAMPVPDLASHLEGQGFEKDEALARAALSGGRPRLARELDLEARRDRREEVVAALEAIASSGPGLDRLPILAGHLAGPNEETLLDGLDLLESLLRDVERLGAGLDATELFHADIGQRLIALSRRIAPARAAEIVRSVERLRSDLRFNVNRTLVAEALLAAVAGGPTPGYLTPT